MPHGLVCPSGHAYEGFMTLHPTGARFPGQAHTGPRPGSHGPPAHELVARTEKELVDAVREADLAGTPVRVVGSATSDGAHGFDGRVVRVAPKASTSTTTAAARTRWRSAGASW